MTGRNETPGMGDMAQAGFTIAEAPAASPSAVDLLEPVSELIGHIRTITLLLHLVTDRDTQDEGTAYLYNLLNTHGKELEKAFDVAWDGLVKRTAP